MILESHMPEKQIQPWKIIVCKGKEVCRFVCLSKSWINLKTHWWGQRTVVCCGTSECEPCKHGVRRDFRAYVGGKSLKNGHEGIISLTETACDSLGPQFMCKRGLLGLIIAVGRLPHKDTGMMTIVTHGYADSVGELKHDDLEAMLIRIFSLNCAGRPVDKAA